MADRHPTRAGEQYAEHAYTGGYDMGNMYAKKKPSDTSHVSSVEDSSTGPYAGSQYASPYLKTAAKPTKEEDYSESQLPAASSGYGKHDNFGESRPSGSVEEEGQYSSRPGYGRRPNEYETSEGEGRLGGPGHGRKPNYGGEYKTEEQSPQSGGYGGRKPASAAYDDNQEFSSRPSARPQSQYGGSIHDSDSGYGGRKPAAVAYGENEEFSSRPSARPQSQYGGSIHDSDSGYGGRKPAAAAYGENEEFPSRPSARPQSQYGDPIHDSDSGYGGRKPGAAAYGENEEFPSRPSARPQSQYGGPIHDSDSGYGGRKPAAAAYGENEEFPSRPSARPQSQYGSTIHDSDLSEGRIPGQRRPGWQQGIEESGYGEPGLGGGRRPPHGHPESEFTGYEAPRPTYRIPNEEEEYRVKPPERFGRQNDGDWLASETAGLSLGTDRYGGREEGYRPKRDDSDSDDEKKHQNRHHEKHGHHHQKHYDDY